MKKFFSLVATATLCASSAMAAVVYEPETEFKTIDELTASGGFAIINKADGKALYGSNAQNLAYDVYEKAFVDTNSGYKWRLNADAGDGNYYLQLLTPAGADYNCWGMGGVLNSQGEPQGWACSFILGLSDKKGQDIVNGAVYTLTYSAENAGWSIKNVGTGQYQGFNNGPAHSDNPSYFQFVSLKQTEVKDPVLEEVPVIASLASIIENGTTFLLSSADKYLYGSENQNAAWTDNYATAKAATNKVNQFKLEYVTAGGKYLFHAYNEGNEVAIYGATPCYLNSQPAANGVIFIMGKDQDCKDGSSWKVAEVEGGYTIQNIANGAYLTSNGLSAEPAVFALVADVPVASVALGEDFEMTVGDAAKTLTATVLPENATSKVLTWTSSAEAVATVENGVVTAVGAGEAEIIATANNGKADTVKVTVKAAEVEEPEIEYVALKTWNFRDAAQFPKDIRVTVASLTIDYDTVPGGIMLKQSTDAMWDGLAFEPAANDGTQSWWVRARNGGTDYGLGAINQNRWFAVTGLQAGYKVTVDAKAAMPLADSTMVSEIVQNESSLCGQGVSFTYTMAKPGFLAFQNNGVYMYRISIDAPIVARYVAHDWNFRDAAQFPKDIRVAVASLTIDYDTVPGGIMLKKSTDAMWDGLAFEPSANDGTQSWWVRARNGGADYGLGAINQNRWFAIVDLKAGAKVTVEAKAAMPLADSTMVASVVQNESTSCGQGVGFTYTIAKDGMLALQNNGVYMYRIIVEQPVNYMVETVRDFRDATQYPKDTRVTVASLTIDYDTVPGGIMLKKSTDAMWDGLAFEPSANDGTQSWWVRARNGGADYGLGAINQNRWFAVIDLKAGETVTIEAKAAMPLADSTMVSAIVQNESTACGQGVSYTYTMAKDGMIAFQNNGVYMYRIITNQYGGLNAGTPMPTITAEGETYMANLITIECAAEGATITYIINEGEEQTYTEPFYLPSSAVIAAKADLNGVVSKTAYLAVTAGEVVAPTVSTIAANNEERTVVIASATAPAYLMVNGDSVANNDTVKITATTDYEVVAVYVDEHVGNILSDTVKTTVEAGYPVQLNQVSVVKVSDSDTAWVFTVDNSSVDIIGQPETQISYEVYPSGEKADVAHGDTLTFATHQRITLVANAEGYATSEPMIVWTREPAKLELVWSDDYQTIAEEKTGAGNNYGVVLKDPTFSVGGYDLCPVQVADDYVSNENFGVQSGTSWLQRNVNGYIGLYNYNSGPRRFGINNLRKTQVVKLTVQDPAQVFLDNDVLQLDETNSTANTLYYNCVKDGAALLNMSRYYCIWKVEVFNNPDVTASPNIYIAGKDEDARIVAVAPAEVAYPANQFTYYAISNGTRVDSTLVKEATDSTAAVYSYDTVAVYTDFASYDEMFKVAKPNNVVVAYTEYEGKPSEQNIVEIDCDSLFTLIDPTINWVEKNADGQNFTIGNANLIEAGLYPEIKVSYNGETASYYGAEIPLAVAGSGWMQVQALLPGMDTSYVASVYVAEARESYEANYYGVMNGDTLTQNASMGDFEIEADAIVSGAYPAKNIAVSNSQYVHRSVSSEYVSMTLPFAFTVGKNVITDAKGNALVVGEDYEILTLHNQANANLPTGKLAENVICGANLDECVRASANIAQGTAILFHALSDKVGSEIILESAKSPVQVGVTATSQPASGWKIYANKRYQEVALEGAAYVLNAEGNKFVWTESPVISGLQVAIMADSATVAALGTVISLDRPVVLTDCDLTRDMFHEWDSYEANGNIVGAGGCDEVWGTPTGMPYGNGSVIGAQYADLTGYAVLALTVTEGTPRLLFNRPTMGGEGGGYIEINSATSEYVYAVVDNVWYIDIAKITANNGYAHLNVIKANGWNTTVTITSAKLLVKYPESTGIESVNAVDVENGKFMINGKLYIVRNGRQYNAEGAVIK